MMERDTVKSLIVAYYLSRRDKEGLNKLGYKSFKEAFSDLGNIIDEKPSNLRNMRDEFDPLFPNKRKGWDQRPLRPSRQKVYDYFSVMSDEELDIFIKRLLSGENMSNTMYEQLYLNGADEIIAVEEDKLKDLGELVAQSRTNLMENFSHQDTSLSSHFKSTYSRIIEQSGSKIEFEKATAIITNSLGLTIYIANQWFVIAKYAVDLVKEIITYRTHTESIISEYGNDIRGTNGERLEKNDIYKGLKENADNDLIVSFTNATTEYFEGQYNDKTVIQHNTSMIIRFVTDYAWWLGGKGIERANDYYMSPALGVLQLVNASQSYVSTLVYQYATIPELNNQLDTIEADNETADENNEKAFKDWMRKQVIPDGDSNAGNLYSEQTINTYTTDIKYHKIIVNDKEATLFATNDISVIDEVLTLQDITTQRKTAVNKYKQFIAENLIKIRYETGIQSEFKRNKIIFGAPGTGKSYNLEQDRKKVLENETVGGYERVTFHPDYTYSQFVGAYKPVTDVGGEISYQFVPGPFMRVYVEALKNGRTDEPQPFILLIEEINRANVAAVFGDIFQLLDRDSSNVSEYPIQASEDIRKYLAEQLGGAPDDYNEIRIPDNMFIWATMNSADQGVFPMDTAFKRRWDFTYLGIDTGEDKIAGKTVILGKGEHRKTVEWNTLRKEINKVLLNDCKVNEDKLMGPFFIAMKNLPKGDEIDAENFSRIFKNKVIMYLFDDAAKQKRPTLFDGCDVKNLYSAICEEFDTKGVDIFSEPVRNAFIASVDESEQS